MFKSKQEMKKKPSNLLRLGGLWEKQGRDGESSFYTGEITDPGRATSEAASVAINRLSENELNALANIIGKRVNIFENPGNSEGEYRLMLADPSSQGEERKPLRFAAPLSRTATGSALRGSFKAEAYPGLLSMTGTLVVTKIEKRNSSRDADYALWDDAAGQGETVKSEIKDEAEIPF